MQAAADPGASGGLRVLLVEDNFLVAASLRRALIELGCEVVGPAPSVEEGVRMAASERLSGAILDVNIRGGTSAPIAESLRERRLPFFFITGYASPQMLPRSLLSSRRLHKPVSRDALARAIVQEFLQG